MTHARKEAAGTKDAKSHCMTPLMQLHFLNFPSAAAGGAAATAQAPGKPQADKDDEHAYPVKSQAP